METSRQLTPEEFINGLLTGLAEQNAIRSIEWPFHEPSTRTLRALKAAMWACTEGAEGIPLAFELTPDTANRMFVYEQRQARRLIRDSDDYRQLVIQHHSLERWRTQWQASSDLLREITRAFEDAYQGKSSRP